MTPIERIRQKREMVQLSHERARPKSAPKAFPRNSSGLAVVMFMVLPLVYKAAIDPNVSNIIGYSLCVLGFGLGLFAISLGQHNTAIYDAKFVARAHRVPFKCIGSAVMGMTASSLTVFQDGTVAQAAAVFPVVTALSLVAFGIDVRKSKGLKTIEERHAHKLETLAARVGLQIERVHSSAARLAVPEVMPEIRRFDDAVSHLLSAVTDDPDRVSSVRKYFSIYLNGIADASERFAGVYGNTGSGKAKIEYIALLQKMTDAYLNKAQAYAAAGQEKLDIEMQVLDDYLSREPALA